MILRVEFVNWYHNHMSKIQIVPTITAQDPTYYAEDLVKMAFAPRLHVDIADGQFAPNRTVNLNQIYFDNDEFARAHFGQLREVDLHLMVEEPTKLLHQIVALAPTRAIFPAEVLGDDFVRLCEYLERFDIQFGIALLAQTSVASVRKMIEIADFVLIFGGRLGFQGGVADLTNLAKARLIREINPDCEIAWDGGANADNVVEIVRAGVETINVGAAISRAEDPESEWRRLTQLAQRA